MKKLILIFLFFPPFYVQADSLDFKQAWNQLVHVSDKLKASNYEVNRAQAKEKESNDLNLPEINLVGSATHLSDPFQANNPLYGKVPITTPIIGPAASNQMIEMSEQDVFRSSLQAMWPIYTGGKITAAQSIHSAMVREKEQQLQLTTNELFVSLVDRYYGVMVSKSAANTYQKLVKSLEKHADHAKKLEEQGQIAKVERLNAQVALENAKIQAASARRQAEMAEIALSRMLHKSHVDTRSKLFTLSYLPSLSELTKKTMHDHPALRLLKAKEDQAQGLIDVQKGGYYPTVFLYGNYTLYEDDSLFSQAEPDWLIGIGIKITLLSRDGRSGKVEAAKSAQLQARYTRAQTQQDLNLLLEQSYRQLLQAAEENHSLDLSVELAQENKRLRDIAFKQGLSTSIEKVDAELKLNAVYMQQLNAQYQYIKAYARLMSISNQTKQFIANSRTK
jgi:outer membrane protein TolC